MEKKNKKKRTFKQKKKVKKNPVQLFAPKVSCCKKWVELDPEVSCREKWAESDPGFSCREKWTELDPEVNCQKK